MSNHGPGWYPDPHDPGLERWWDGVRWTEHARGHRTLPSHGGASARSSTPAGLEVAKPSEKREGLLNKAWSHAVLTSVGIIVTALVSGAAGQQKQEDLKRRGGQALLKSQETISELLTMQKAANAELLACRAGGASPPSARASESGAASPPQGAAVAAVSNVANLDGEWLTPDGTVVWQIQGNRAAIHSTGELTGFVTGSASIALQAGSVSGTLNAATYYGLVMGSAAFQGQVQGDFINGSIRDESGTTQPLVLVRARPE